MFLFGMKIMSDGLQKSAGERMRKTLNFMTGNRFIGILTGFIATAIIQSSSAFSVIVVSFVNAGLINLTQSIGVIFGMNIGTTLTGWIVSIVGFKVHIDSFALPAIGIGFLASVIKWKYRSVGDFLLGFGFLFLGLHFLTDGLANVHDVIDFNAVGALGEYRFLAILIGFGVGFVMTLIINSSTASITLIMALSFQNIIPYEMAAGMVLGANIGTTLDAPLASIAGNNESRRAALAHVLFSVIGVLWALPLLIPLLKFIAIILPGDPWAAGGSNEAIPLHLAGLHTAFNIITTLLFLPFVKQYAQFLTFIIPDRETDKKKQTGPYKFEYVSAGNVDSPELNIIRAESEISEMAKIVSFMYSRFYNELKGLRNEGDITESVKSLCTEMREKEEYIDQMRDALSDFLIECSRAKLKSKSNARISYLMQVIVALEAMSDECFSISLLLEKAINKNNMLKIKNKEMDVLIPYVGQVEKFLALLENQLGRNPSEEQMKKAGELEAGIDKSRKKLQKLGRKRIEAGKNVKAELIFIDLVRRIEKLGDYCFEISAHARPAKKE